MKLIRQGDSRVLSIIGKKKPEQGGLYRLSQYTIKYARKDIYLLKNILTGQVCQLTEDEWSLLPVSGGAISCSELEEHGLTELAANRILVEQGCDDCGQYKLALKILKTMEKKKKGFRTYVIFPTTGCNARCVYCFEKDYIPKTMTNKTVDRLIEYIMETKCDDTIKLKWFGGEPLAAERIITRICQELRARGVEFKSSIVTNASLMTKELAETAKNIWNLENVQVSLDGDKRSYEQRKRFIDPSRHNFETVIDAMHFMVGQDMKINIRCNFDRNNLDGLREFSHRIADEFGDCPNVSVYFALLFQERETEMTEELLKRAVEAERYIYSIGLKRSKSDSAKKYKMRQNYCMADSMDNVTVIDPDGVLYNCEHLSPDNAFGNIFDGITDKEKYDRLRAEPVIHPECASCAFLPRCTPFYRGGCPGWFMKCAESRQIEAEYELELLADKLE